LIPIDYTARGLVSPSLTLLFVYGLAFVMFVAFVNAIMRARRHAARAREATASVATKEPAAQGYAVLRGTVESEDPERPAVVVTITETGTERKQKGKWSHTWTEINRKIEVEPFYLVLASGTRVLIEPGQDIFFVDKLERVHGGNPRTRAARLDNGEIVHVSGTLVDGWHTPRAGDAQGGLYRGGAPTGLVMRPGKERMLLSTEPLARRPQRLQSAHRAMAIVLAVTLLLMNGLLFGSTHLVQFFGEVSELRVLATRTWLTRHKNNTTRHYGVTGAYPKGDGTELPLEDEVSAEAYAIVTSGGQAKVPFRVVHAWPTQYAIGTGPTIGVTRIIFSIFALVGLVVIYAVLLDSAREWYDRKKVVEQGSGRLTL
jgi:hypothetical protein